MLMFVGSNVMMCVPPFRVSSISVTTLRRETQAVSTGP